MLRFECTVGRLVCRLSHTHTHVRYRDRYQLKIELYARIRANYCLQNIPCCAVSRNYAQRYFTNSWLFFREPPSWSIMELLCLSLSFSSIHWLCFALRVASSIFSNFASAYTHYLQGSAVCMFAIFHLYVCVSTHAHTHIHFHLPGCSLLLRWTRFSSNRGYCKYSQGKIISNFAIHVILLDIAIALCVVCVCVFSFRFGCILVFWIGLYKESRIWPVYMHMSLFGIVNPLCGQCILVHSNFIETIWYSSWRIFHWAIPTRYMQIVFLCVRSRALLVGT